MKLNECFIIPKSVTIAIQRIAIETQNQELMNLGTLSRTAFISPEEVVSNAFEAGWAYGHATFKNLIPNKEEYIKNLEL